MDSQQESTDCEWPLGGTRVHVGRGIVALLFLSTNLALLTLALIQLYFAASGRARVRTLAAAAAARMATALARPHNASRDHSSGRRGSSEAAPASATAPGPVDAAPGSQRRQSETQSPSLRPLHGPVGSSDRTIGHTYPGLPTSPPATAPPATAAAVSSPPGHNVVSRPRPHPQQQPEELPRRREVNRRAAATERAFVVRGTLLCAIVSFVGVIRFLDPSGATCVHSKVVSVTLDYIHSALVYTLGLLHASRIASLHYVLVRHKPTHRVQAYFAMLSLSIVVAAIASGVLHELTGKQWPAGVFLVTIAVSYALALPSVVYADVYVVRRSIKTAGFSGRKLLVLRALRKATYFFVAIGCSATIAVSIVGFAELSATSRPFEHDYGELPVTKVAFPILQNISVVVSLWYTWIPRGGGEGKVSGARRSRAASANPRDVELADGKAPGLRGAAAGPGAAREEPQKPSPHSQKVSLRPSSGFSPSAIPVHISAEQASRSMSRVSVQDLSDWRDSQQRLSSRSLDASEGWRGSRDRQRAGDHTTTSPPGQHQVLASTRASAAAAAADPPLPGGSTASLVRSSNLDAETAMSEL